MNPFCPTYKKSVVFKCQVVTVIMAFLSSLVIPPQFAQAQVLNLPAPGAMLTTTAVFNPSIIKGLTIHPDNPLKFDFIIDPGQETLKDEAFKQESMKMIKYFMSALTVPDDQLWVNLSPYEKDRIMADGLGQTVLGQDMLIQDYLLKQLTASLMYPEENIGEEFWRNIYAKAQAQLGTTDIPINTFNKIWIVPQKAVVYVNGQSAFVVESYLKVMLEEDYLAQEHHTALNMANSDDPSNKNEEAKLSAAALREVLIPVIEKEVNEGKTFADLRQIYHAIILASWYKKNLKESILNQVYTDKNKTKGVDLEDKQIKEKIYEQYLSAYKIGVYDFVKEEYDPQTQSIIPRKYFSGGEIFSKTAEISEVIKGDQMMAANLGANLSGRTRNVSWEAKPLGEDGAAFGRLTENEQVAGRARQEVFEGDKSMLADGANSEIIALEQKVALHDIDALKAYKKIISRPEGISIPGDRIKDALNLKGMGASIERIFSKSEVDLLNPGYSRILMEQKEILIAQYKEIKEILEILLIDHQELVTTGMIDEIFNFIDKTSQLRLSATLAVGLDNMGGENAAQRMADLINAFLDFARWGLSKETREKIEAVKEYAQNRLIKAYSEGNREAQLALASFVTRSPGQINNATVAVIEGRIREAIDILAERRKAQGEKISKGYRQVIPEDRDQSVIIIGIQMLKNIMDSRPELITTSTLELLNDVATNPWLHNPMAFEQNESGQWQPVDYSRANSIESEPRLKAAKVLVAIAVSEKFPEGLKEQAFGMVKAGLASGVHPVVRAATFPIHESEGVLKGSFAEDYRERLQDLNDVLIELVSEQVTKEREIANKLQPIVLRADKPNLHLSLGLIELIRKINSGSSQATRQAVFKLLDKLKPFLDGLQALPKNDIVLNILNRIADMVAAYPGRIGTALAERFAKRDEQGGLQYGYLADVFAQLDPGLIARIWKINIKLARYLKEHPVHFEKLLDPERKQIINEIAFNINREVTRHPVELRMGEDEKTGLFNYLLESDIESLRKYKEVFDQHFRNDPSDYEIPITDLIELFQHLSLAETQQIIRSVQENPKESLDSVVKAIKQSISNVENNQFLERRLLHILNNLFVLQERLDQVQPIVAALADRPDAKTVFIKVLEAVDKASSLAALNQIANNEKVSVIHLLQLKLNSRYNVPVAEQAQKREDLIISALSQLDHAKMDIAADVSKSDIYATLLEAFNGLPEVSRQRIYWAVLFKSAKTDQILADVVSQFNSENFAQVSSALAVKPESFTGQFLADSSNRSLVAPMAATEGVLGVCVAQIKSLSKKDQNGAFALLRSLFVKRELRNQQFAVFEKSQASVLSFFINLENQIAIKPVQDTVPHILFHALIKLDASGEILRILGKLSKAIDNHPQMRDQSATLKNRLYELINLFAPGASGDKKIKRLAFNNIMQVLKQEFGELQESNLVEYYGRLTFYLAQFLRILPLYETHVASTEQGQPSELTALAVDIVSQLNSETPQIDIDKIDVISKKLEQQAATQFVEFFRKNAFIDEQGQLRYVEMGDQGKVIEDLTNYMLTNPQFQRRDYEKRNVIDLIVNAYLPSIRNLNVAQTIFDAMMAEARGEFTAWKHSSPDYLATLSLAIDITASRLIESEEKRQKFNQAMGVNAQNNFYDYSRLQKLDGFDSVKAVVKQIKEGWEADISSPLQEGLTANFVGDFISLFNIGNYQGSTACQRPTYGSDLNRGLAGYVGHGTNKALTILNREGQVVPARRIVRLRVIINEKGERELVIFVEESTQFGGRANNIDNLYAVLDQVSNRTGLRVAVGAYRPAESAKVNQGTSGQYGMYLFKGRTFDYSDYYGRNVPEDLPYTAGLHLLKNDQILSPMKMVIRELPLGVEQRFDLNVAVVQPLTDDSFIEQAENNTGVDMVVIQTPNEQQRKKHSGYFYKPAKVSYELDLPVLEAGQSTGAAMDQYYAKFDSKKRNQFKKDVRKIDDAVAKGEIEFVMDDKGTGVSDFEGFLELYQSEMDAKERGRKPLLDAVAKAGGNAAYLQGGRAILYLKLNGRVVAGMVAKDMGGYYSIGFAATNSELRGKIRNMQFYLMQRLMQHSIEKSFKTLNYGVDTNFYGHHLDAGLMQYKVNSGFHPVSSGDAQDELMKINRFDKLNMPVFFYTLGEKGQLESTLILSDDMVDEVKKFEGVTEKLSIYALRLGQLVKTSVEEMQEMKNKAEKGSFPISSDDDTADAAMLGNSQEDQVFRWVLEQIDDDNITEEGDFIIELPSRLVNEAGIINILQSKFDMKRMEGHPHLLFKGNIDTLLFYDTSAVRISRVYNQIIGFASRNNLVTPKAEFDVRTTVVDKESTERRIKNAKAGDVIQFTVLHHVDLGEGMFMAERRSVTVTVGDWEVAINVQSNQMESADAPILVAQKTKTENYVVPLVDQAIVSVVNADHSRIIKQRAADTVNYFAEPKTPQGVEASGINLDDFIIDFEVADASDDLVQKHLVKGNGLWVHLHPYRKDDKEREGISGVNAGMLFKIDEEQLAQGKIVLSDPWMEGDVGTEGNIGGIGNFVSLNDLTKEGLIGDPSMIEAMVKKAQETVQKHSKLILNRSEVKNVLAEAIAPEGALGDLREMFSFEGIQQWFINPQRTEFLDPRTGITYRLLPEAAMISELQQRVYQNLTQIMQGQPLPPDTYFDVTPTAKESMLLNMSLRKDGKFVVHVHIKRGRNNVGLNVVLPQLPTEESMRDVAVDQWADRLNIEKGNIFAELDIMEGVASKGRDPLLNKFVSIGEMTVESDQQPQWQALQKQLVEQVRQLVAQHLVYAIEAQEGIQKGELKVPHVFLDSINYPGVYLMHKIAGNRQVPKEIKDSNSDAVFEGFSIDGAVLAWAKRNFDAWREKRRQALIKKIKRVEGEKAADLLLSDHSYDQQNRAKVINKLRSLVIEKDDSRKSQFERDEAAKSVRYILEPYLMLFATEYLHRIETTENPMDINIQHIVSDREEIVTPELIEQAEDLILNNQGFFIEVQFISEAPFFKLNIIPTTTKGLVTASQLAALTIERINRLKKVQAATGPNKEGNSGGPSHRDGDGAMTAQGETRRGFLQRMGQAAQAVLFGSAAARLGLLGAAGVLPACSLVPGPRYKDIREVMTKTRNLKLYGHIHLNPSERKGTNHIIENIDTLSDDTIRSAAQEYTSDSLTSYEEDLKQIGKILRENPSITAIGLETATKENLSEVIAKDQENYRKVIARFKKLGLSESNARPLVLVYMGPVRFMMLKSDEYPEIKRIKPEHVIDIESREAFNNNLEEYNKIYSAIQRLARQTSSSRVQDFMQQVNTAYSTEEQLSKKTRDRLVAGFKLPWESFDEDIDNTLKQVIEEYAPFFKAMHERNVQIIENAVNFDKTDGDMLIVIGRGHIADLEAIVKKRNEDKSMLNSQEVGGIDFNPQNMEMDIQGQLDAQTQEQLNELDLQQLQIDGFYPVILNIGPVQNLPLLLGIKDAETPPQEAAQIPANTLSFAIKE